MAPSFRTRDQEKRSGMSRLIRKFALALLLLGVMLLSGAGGAWADSGDPSDPGGVPAFVAYLRMDTRPLAAVRFHGDVRVVAEGERLGDAFQVMSITESEIQVRRLPTQEVFLIALEQVVQAPSGDPAIVQGPAGSPPNGSPTSLSPVQISGMSSPRSLEISRNASVSKSPVSPDPGSVQGGTAGSVPEQPLSRADTLRRAFGVDQSRESPATLEDFLRRLQRPEPGTFAPKAGG